MQLEMRDVAGDEDKIERTLARHLLRDVDIAAPCVPRLGQIHEESLASGHT
jgi:hypothetical protein